MLLQMKDITKRYDQTLANNKVNISLNKGEILAIVGENGAGKSTIMKILYGLEKANSGKIFLNNQEVCFKSALDAIKNHIGMVQQHFMLFENFSVYENVVYGLEPRKTIFFDRKKAIEITKDLSLKYGLKIDPYAKISDCSIGQQQKVEILKILYQNAEVIIFDEPTAVLTPLEIKDLLITIKNLAKLNKSIIIITHKLQEVMDISDRIIVMRKGEVVKEVKTATTSIDELSYAMVGKHLQVKNIERLKPQEVVLETNNLSLKSNNKYLLDHINIKVCKNEIVGIAGVSGNGQSELIKALSGLIKYQGKIYLDNQDISHLSVKKIRQKGLACIPEDRYFSGCAKDANLLETTLMAKHSESYLAGKHLLKTQEIIKYTDDLIKQFDVRCNTNTQQAKSLSGGNIQKLIVARELSHQSKFLIAAEPTRGVDIGAMEFIHQKLLEKKKDAGILLISSELSEILDLSDRIYVIYDGKIVKEFSKEEIDIEKISLLMMGGQCD